MNWRDMKIVAAAVHHNGEIFTMPPPARHHDILHDMHQRGIKQNGNTEQGFVTDTGAFVRRKPALMIAKNAGQFKRREGGYDGPELFSEDLW